MKNATIRGAAKAAGVKLWEIADALGIRDNEFSRRLRHELPEKESARILAIIQNLQQAREEEEA